MLDAIKCVVDDNFVFQQNGASCVHHSATAAVQSSQFPFSCMCDGPVKAKFHYASWFEAGSKLVADRFEAGRRQASNLSATSFEPASNQIA